MSQHMSKSNHSTPIFPMDMEEESEGWISSGHEVIQASSCKNVDSAGGAALDDSKQLPLQNILASPGPANLGDSQKRRETIIYVTFDSM